eukprot:Transcript_9007.p2 GENE.Transcript_9007~~Transcript_9007.p2  ORF type:complete len:498 (+),score=180.33 Transcript_9007:1017-2510(+)
MKLGAAAIVVVVSAPTFQTPAQRDRARSLPRRRPPLPATMILPSGRTRLRRVLFLTYEFTFSPFSGNGMLSRCIALSLLRAGYDVRVLCAQPAPSELLSANNPIGPPEVGAEQAAALELWPVQLEPSAGWKKVDRSAAWEAYARGAAAMAERVAAYAPQVAVVVDWHGGAAWRALCEAQWRELAPPMLYWNFRVYASGLPQEEGAWYDAHEAAALRLSSLCLALSVPDRASLLGLLPPGAPPAPHSRRSGEERVELLLPPLRGDIELLARRDAAQHAPAFPPLAEGCAAPPDAPAEGAAPPRRYVSCVVRLSREKDPMLFVHLMERLRPALRELGLAPLLCGAAAEPEYAAEVKARLRASFPEAAIIDAFLGPQQLAAVFSQTLLNVHPCAYEAYGMTIVEAAAFGAPSVLNGGGTIGAARLLGAADGAALELDLSQPHEKLAEAVGALLADGARLAAVAAAARERALAWNETAFGAELATKLEALVETAGGEGVDN